MVVAVFLSLSSTSLCFFFFSSSVFLFFFLSVGWPGRPLCSRPRGASPVLPPCGRQVVSFVGVFLVVSEKKGAGKAGEKSLLLPLFSTRPREEEDLWCRSKRHRLFFFFLFSFLKCMKLHRFSQNAPFHLNGNWRQNASDSKLGLQFVRFFILVLGFGFLQLSPQLAIKLQYLCN